MPNNDPSPRKKKKKPPTWRERLGAVAVPVKARILANRFYVGLFCAYLVLLAATAMFYLRRDVMGLQQGDLVFLDVHAPRDLVVPKPALTEEDLAVLAQAGEGKTRHVGDIRPLALGALREAFAAMEGAAERAEAAGIVRVERPYLPKSFPLEQLLAVDARERLMIRWAAHRGLSHLYAGGIPVAKDPKLLRERLLASGAFDDLSTQHRELALQSAAAFSLPDTHQDLLSTLQNLREQGKGPTVTIAAGERILRAGQTLTAQDVAMLAPIRRQVGNQMAWRLVFVGVVLFVTLFLFLRLVQLIDPNLLKGSAFFWVATLTGVVLFLSVPVAMKIKFAYLGYTLSGFLVFNAILVSALFRPSIASLLVVFQVVLLATVFNIPPRFMMPAFVVSVFSLVLFKARFMREDLIRLGVWSAGMAAALALGTELAASQPFDVVAASVGVAAFATMLGAIVALGTLPVFEKVLNIATANTLLELANPNHPLLRKVFVEAPGTYHHSMMMANLCEAAAEALGGDALLVRVGCYYHDIGKTRRPEFFTENTNPGEQSVHENLAPSLSALVIINHVKEGIEMGRAARLPESIIRMIPAHHGTSLVSYFYNKAKIQAGDNEVDEAQFRYPGPKPQTLEEGIIMLADACEASVRSLPNFSIKAVEDQVDRIIQGKLDDGQLDDCSLTLQQLDVIRQVFVKTLCKIHHHRINYDKGLQQEVEKFKQKEAGRAGARGAS